MNRRNEPDGPRRPDLRKIVRAAAPLNFVSRLTDGEPAIGSAHGSAGAAPGPSFPEGTFLGELGAAYAAELAEIGCEYAFAPGEVVIREGEPAGDIYLIFEGRARVTVNSPGGPRTIAIRGPGDLIGERAASVKRKRSATAVAVAELRGIQVEAGAFTEFLQRHRKAVDVLESQMYDRMTASEGPRIDLSGQNCTVLLLDIAQFSASARTDPDRMAIVKACYRMLQDALTHTGVDWNACHNEDRGDGALVIFPADVRTEDVVNRLVRRLAANLRRHNKKALPGRRFRLRAAIEVGPITAHEYGVNGETIISAARLVEATRLKAAVLEPDVVIGIATSTWVFERVARHLPEADAYEHVKFQVKEWKGAAWMRLYRD